MLRPALYIAVLFVSTIFAATIIPGIMLAFMYTAYALIKTLEISVLILFLVAASNFFGTVFSRLGTPTLLTRMLLDMDLSQIQVLLIIMILIFVLSWPLEWGLKDIYIGMMQFMVNQLIDLGLILAFLQIALRLPKYIYG